MPLLGKRPFLLGSQVKPDFTGPIFVISHTKERFSSESEYEKRKDLYAQSIWTCRATGHINLTHEDAMKSEQAIGAQLKEQFSKCFEKDVLEVVHHNTLSLDSLVDNTWLKLHQELVPGERINLKVKVADKLIPAKIVSVDKSPVESKDGSSCNSPSSDKENHSDDKDKSPKKWTPPKLFPYLYSIELDQEAKVIHSVPADDLIRLERIPSKDLLRLFIRVSALRSGNAATSPWVVNAELVRKYKLVNKFNDFFLSPVKMAEASKRAEENKKKRKLSNSTHTSACKKLKLDKGKGKELKVLQLNKSVKGKTQKKKEGKQSETTPKKTEQGSPKKSSPKKKSDSFIIISESDEEVALSKLKKDKVSRSASDSDSDVPLYQLIDQTTPKKKQKTTKAGSDSSDEDVPLAKISLSPKKSSVKKNNDKSPTKKQKKEKKKDKDPAKKKESKKSLKLAQKTGMKQATLFDLNKKGKTMVQKTPVKKTPTKNSESKASASSSPPIPAIVRRLQNAKRETLTDKMKYSMLLKNAVSNLTPAQLKKVPDKLREEIERKKNLMEEKAKLSKMTDEEREQYLQQKRLKAKQLQKQKMLQKMRDQRKRFEDTDLDLTPLPTPRMVPTPDGFPNDLFGEVAMVTEFINCYGGLLMPDSEYPIFTDALMKALVGGSNGFTYLSRVLTVMLQTLLQDDLAKGYKELETLLSDVPVSAFTASELARLCLQCEEEDDDEEDDELVKATRLLNDTEFYQLELDQKVVLLRGLCSRVLETYAVQDYMEEQQRKANALVKQKVSDMKQMAAQKKTEKQESPSVKPSKSEESTSNEKENTENKTENGCVSITSFYGKEAAQDSGEEGVDWGSVVKRRRVLAAQAAAEKEKRDKEKMIQKEKEIQMERVRRKQEQMVDAISLARMVLRQEPIGTDRHHDRYWVFTNTTPGLYIEKGWMGEEVHYVSKPKPTSEGKISDDELSSDSDSEDGNDITAAMTNVTANQTGMTPMKIKYLTKKHFIETSTPHPGQNLWLTYRSVKDFDSLLTALHPQGIRESLLKAELNKRYDDIVRAINLAQRTNLELRSSDGDDEMVTSFKKELYDMELRLRNGGLGGVLNFVKWEKKLNDTSDIAVMGECMLELKANVTEKFIQGFMKPPVKAEEEKEDGENEVKEEEEEDEEVEEKEKTHVKESKNEKAFRQWKEFVTSCQTMSRLHVLLAMLDSCIKWEKSAANARCKICRKKGDDECLLLCDECNQAFHLYCLRPALSKVPTTDWFCPACKPRRHTPVRHIESESEEEKEEKDEVCRECGGADKLIVCSKCPSAFHTQCHDPPLRRPPRGLWECSDCKNGISMKRRKLTRKANVKKRYQESTEEENESEEEEEEEEEQIYRSRSRSRSAKSTRSRDRKTSSRNTSLRESTGSSLTPTSRTSRRGPSELSLCEEVLSRVVKHKSSWPFLEPVDKKQVPDYHLLIKKPMDFQTMQKNCARLKYASPQEFIEDAALVFENAESYNKPDTEVFQCMREVEKIFKEQLKKLLPDWPYYRTIVEHDSSSGSEAGKRRSRNK